MTTTTAPPLTVPASSSTHIPTTAPAYRLTLGRVIRSEWIKIRTLRSTWIGMASVLLVLVGFGAIAASVSTGTVTTPSDGGGGGFGASDPLSTVLSGASFAVLLVGVLGSLAGAREHSSRMITATVGAVPRRWQIVVSKAVALVAVVLPTALVAVFATYGVGMAILAGGGSSTVALTDSGVLTSVVGMAGYITAIALIGMALGLLLRSVAGSILVVVGGVLILPTLAGALLPAGYDPLLQYLPSSAAAAFTAVTGAGADVLGSAAGVGVLLAWVVLALGAATVSITRRDV